MKFLDNAGNPTTLDVLNERARQWHAMNDEAAPVVVHLNVNCADGAHRLCRGTTGYSHKGTCECPCHARAA